MAIPVRIRRNADGTINDITLCPKQEDIYSELTKIKQQLEIAVKMLEKIRHTEDWRLAHEALVQIRGVR